MYLDHAATTPLRPEARKAVLSALDDFGGNPSGSHADARKAKNLLEESREQIADAVGANRPDEIVFVSGGTEADNLAVLGASLASGERSVVVSAIEHKAVLEPAAALEDLGHTVRLVAPNRDGVVTPAALGGTMDENVGLVSVMAANNETGAVQPIEQLVATVRKVAPNAVVHSDAVQAFVGGPLSVDAMNVDLLTLASHKFGGPKGVGVLFVRSGVQLDPLLHGGGQEAGRRSGTSNVAGAAGMAAAVLAVEASRGEFESVVRGERDDFERQLIDRLGAVPTTPVSERLPHFSHVRIPGVNAETLLIRLDQSQLSAAAGSSCQSGAVEPSHVLSAMGMKPHEAAECVRFTFGWTTKQGEGQQAADAVARVVEAMR